MPALRDRLQWNAATGTVHDGPRRYLLMRPDVLMGALLALDAAGRQAWLDAWLQSAFRHGGDSLAAYAESAGADAAALAAATVTAAADLGWGRWQLRHDADTLHLDVDDSPFAEGWQRAGGTAAALPVCAPIGGLLLALARLLLGPEASVSECDCVAMGAPCCRFEARTMRGGSDTDHG